MAELIQLQVSFIGCVNSTGYLFFVMSVFILRNENADLGGEMLFPLIQDEEDDLDGMIGELQVELGDMQQRILEDNKRARYFFESLQPRLCV